ncbi:MAG: PIN domain-containing protein [Deltaproteobacteria bacterium]
MIEPQRATHVVLDTDVTSWILADPASPRAEAIRRVVGRRTRLLSFVTVTELRYGALRAGWGEFRLRRLERSLADFEFVQTDIR